MPAFLLLFYFPHILENLNRNKTDTTITKTNLSNIMKYKQLHIVGSIGLTTQLCTVLDFKSGGSIKINHMEFYTGIAYYHETCIFAFWNV